MVMALRIAVNSLTGQSILVDLTVCRYDIDLERG